MSGPSKLLAQDAWRPSISPDGKRLLLYGSETPMEKRWLPTNWKGNPSYTPLCVADRNGQNRRPISVWSRYPTMRWFSDSQRILIFAPPAPMRDYNVLEEWNLDSLRKHDIWSGKGRNYQDVSLYRQKIGESFGIGGFSQDERHLFVVTRMYTDTKTHFLNATDSEEFLWKLDLATGETQKVARFFNSFGLEVQAPN